MTESLSLASDEADLPRLQAGGSPQHLLLTLLGDYWFGQEAHLPSAALVALLEEFDVTGVSARAALSRLARRNLLQASKSGRNTYYGLSPRAARVLSEGVAHILSFGGRDQPWSGRWTIATFSIPEEQRDLRHTLRTRLRWMGFASLYDGVWVSPHDLTDTVAGVFSELAVAHATVFTATVGAGSPSAGDPIRAWDLDALHDTYLELIAEYEPLRERVRAGQIGTKEALLTRTALMDAWRNFPNLDPELPAELLPGEWPRSRARAIFIELYDGLAGLAEARVRQVLTPFAPNLAGLVRSHGSSFAG